MDKLEYQNIEFKGMEQDSYYAPGAKPVQVCVYVCVCVCVCVRARASVCVCVCVSPCITHTHAHTYTHTQIAPAKSVPYLGEIQTKRTKCLVPRAFFKRTSQDKDRLQVVDIVCVCMCVCPP